MMNGDLIPPNEKETGRIEAFSDSFFTILIVWLNHHAVFGLVRRADFLFLLANGFVLLLLLLLVTVMPLLTALVTAYLAHRPARWPWPSTPVRFQ